MPSSLEALQALTGGGMTANDPLKLARLRRASLEELSAPGEGGIGGFGASPQFQAETEADLATDPYTGTAERNRIGGIEALNQQMALANRPDVVEARKAVEAAALNKILAPIHAKGQYEVEAAKQSQIGKNLMNQQSIEGRSALEGQRQEGMGTRAEANRAGGTMQQRLNALQTGKAKAAGPGGLGGLLTSQKSLNDAEIAQLQQMLGASSGGMVTMRAPDGRMLQVPADKVAELEAAGAIRQ